MARYKVTFDMPLRLAVGERAMAIAGRLQDRLEAVRVRGVTGPEVATYRIRRGRLRGITVAMTVQARGAAMALQLAMNVLRDAHAGTLGDGGVVRSCSGSSIPRTS